MTDPLAGLEPIAFWRHFDALTTIPRATFEEEAAVAHERLHTGSAERFTRLLSALLDELSR